MTAHLLQFANMQRYLAEIFLEQQATPVDDDAASPAPTSASTWSRLKDRLSKATQSVKNSAKKLTRAVESGRVSDLDFLLSQFSDTMYRFPDRPAGSKDSYSLNEQECVQVELKSRILQRDFLVWVLYIPTLNVIAVSFRGTGTGHLDCLALAAFIF